MKATGIVRRIDDLGRVVIPKEIRRTMRIREGDPLEIYTDTDGQVIFKKYSPMGELSEFAAQICDALHKTTGGIAAVCDRDAVIAVAGGGKRELLDRRISRELEELMSTRGQYAADSCTLPVVDTDERYAVAVAAPILSEGDVLGCVLFMLIPLINKERVPYSAGEKISFKDMLNALKSNKPFMLVIISYFLGFGRQMAMGIQVQAANILLGSQNLVAVLGISTAIGTMISMAACPFLIKKLDEKKVFIGLSVYGFIASVFSFVIAHFWFINPGNTVLTVLFYFSLFLLGLQFASVNLMPMIMTADCVDYYEYETGKRMEGTAYSVLTLTIKICLALGMALGLVFVQVSGYSDTVREIAAGTAAGFTTKTKDTVFFAYSVVPGILSLLSAFPIFKYDIVGKKKQEISDALQARRAAAEK